MKKDTLVQFVCFETALELDQFVPQWENFVKLPGNNKPEAIILQKSVAKTKFKYISEHIWPQDDFKFVFMKGRHSEHFPEARVKVVQAGGYIPLQISHKKHNEEDNVKIIVCVTSGEIDVSLLTSVPNYGSLNIYQAYYESSIYTYILEYFLSETHVADVLQELKTQLPRAEIGVYRECLVSAL